MKGKRRIKEKEERNRERGEEEEGKRFSHLKNRFRHQPL